MMIRIDTSAMRDNAKKFAILRESIGDIAKNLTDICTRLDTAWDGGSSQDVIESLREECIQLDNLGSKFGAVEGRITVIADSFEAVDNSVTQIALATAIGLINPRITRTLGRKEGPLRANLDEMISCGEGCCALGERIKEIAAKNKDIRTSLQEIWEGNAYNSFVKNTEDIGKCLESSQEDVTNLGKKIIQIAERYRDLDAKFTF